MTKALSTSVSLDRATLDRLDALAKANGRSQVAVYEPVKAGSA